MGTLDDHLTDEGDRLNINWTIVFGTFVREIASIVLIVWYIGKVGMCGVILYAIYR